MSTFLTQLPPRLVQEVLSLGQRRAFADGEHLIRHDDDGDFAVILCRARVKVIAVTAGGRSCLLGIRHSGDLLGEMSLLGGMPRCASVIADGPASGCVIPAPRFLQLLRQEPEVAHEVARTVAARLRQADARRADFTYPARVRVIRLIAEEVAEAAADNQPATVRHTQRDIADLIGSSEVTVQKALRELAISGLVTTGYGVLVVPRPARLVTEAHRLMETRHRL
ncbi:Crp/Fnr family transcriptional regulator [Actinoplanes xinjiangensis]|uniref:CRP-like cAMP-binding protein n=1 Tax=Actinoplanes xinjiangensis TaxID=512350 RepID=A0A316ETQ1_9ACTN|nr:Crp/Fnr family transcriptional regulator [Actinoplanes xinjiangensis]PWK35895.1 CRP-like cAMP-binding protein [Actinoplanes xinjiangensis]GIF43078.1 Crp/Fnr family transcriptional regulator [Actinoplanes xinjiangensis]